MSARADSPPASAAAGAAAGAAAAPGAPGVVPAVFAVALVALVLGAATGPAWDAGAAHAVLAAHLERAASAPLYGLLAGAAAQLPLGEVATRLALLAAVLGAATLAGVVAAGRALLPRDPAAAGVGAGLLFLAPPFHDAAGTAGPAMLTAAGVVWTVAAALAHARTPTPRRAVTTLLAVGVVIGSAPWLGAGLALAVLPWLSRRGTRAELLAAGTAALGLGIVALWSDTSGRLPGAGSSLTAMVIASGGGAAAVVIGAGLLGTAFGAVTGLPAARPLGGLLTLVLAHAIVVDPAAAPALALLAVGAAILPGAVVRAVGSPRRTLIAAAAGAPLLGAALAAGAAVTVDDPGAAPAHLATDLVGELPPGPGIVVVTRLPAWFALHYAQQVAGVRPDLVLAPPAPARVADIYVAEALRADQIVGADVSALGRLDPTRALPRGRGFELRGAAPTEVAPVEPPATYASATGADEALALALARARYEAGRGHLDAAARAAGLTARFRAADLALLATAVPGGARPALFGFVPDLAHGGPGAWQLELFGDDLAWVAGLDQPAVTEPPERVLHALWRDMFLGHRAPDDPAIVALGIDAVLATQVLLLELATSAR